MLSGENLQQYRAGAELRKGDRTMKFREVAAAGLAVLLVLIAWNGEASRHQYAEWPLSSHLMKPWPVETQDSGGVLLFSDSPEYVKEHGILYRDVVQGEARIFYYHVNMTAQPGRLAVVLENLGAKSTTVVITRGAMSIPSTTYFEVGKGVEIGYMRMPQPEKKVFLEAASGKLLHPGMDDLLEPRKLMSGMYDFRTSERVQVSVVFCPANVDPVSFVRNAKVLPKDKEALRGTFTGMNRTVKAKRPYDPEKDGMVYISIGDNRYDAYKQGVDATDGSTALNYGNYGILYRYELPLRGKNPTCMMLTPLGGPYSGAVRVETGRKEDRLVHTPRGQLFFGEVTPPDLEADIGRDILLTENFELTNIGNFNAYKRFALEYSPPGASNMPVLLILAPSRARRSMFDRQRRGTIVHRERSLHRNRSGLY